MFRAAQLIGRAIRHVRATDEEALEEAKLSFDVSLLFGGQIKDGPMRLYMIYAAGNFIECGQDAPFLQIGEHKYGKPILDRAVKFTTDIYDALKIGLISMDSTMRSNLGVGLPIDIAVICRDAIEAELVHRIEAGRALFPRPARALVGGAAGRSHGDPPPSLRLERLQSRPGTLAKLDNAPSPQPVLKEDRRHSGPGEPVRRMSSSSLFSSRSYGALTSRLVWPTAILLAVTLGFVFTTIVWTSDSANFTAENRQRMQLTGALEQRLEDLKARLVQFAADPDLLGAGFTHRSRRRRSSGAGAAHPFDFTGVFAPGERAARSPP